MHLFLPQLLKCLFSTRFDGFIVCEEHKDVLLAAWDEEQEIQREREAEVRIYIYRETKF